MSWREISSDNAPVTIRVLDVLMYCTGLRLEVKTVSTNGLYHESTLKK